MHVVGVYGFGALNLAIFPDGACFLSHAPEIAAVTGDSGAALADIYSFRMRHGLTGKVLYLEGEETEAIRDGSYFWIDPQPRTGR